MLLIRWGNRMPLASNTMKHRVRATGQCPAMHAHQRKEYTLCNYCKGTKWKDSYQFGPSNDGHQTIGGQKPNMHRNIQLGRDIKQTNKK